MQLNQKEELIEAIKYRESILNRALSLTEAKKIIDTLIEVVKTTKKHVEKLIEDEKQEKYELRQEIKQAIKDIKLKRGEKGEKGDKGDSIVGPRGADGRDGKDGQSIVGPAGKDGKDGSPDTGEQIVDKINALPIKSEYQIGKEHIKDLEDSLKKLEERITNIPRGGGARSGNSVQYYDISSELDGSTKSFNIPSNRRVLQVIGSSFPFNFRPVVDYTVSGKTLTFTDQIDAPTSLASGQTITVLYVGMFNTI